MPNRVASPAGDIGSELLQPHQCDFGTLKFLKVRSHKELDCFAAYYRLDSSVKFGQPLEQYLEPLTLDRVPEVDFITTRMGNDITLGYIRLGEAQIRALLNRRILDRNCALLVASNLLSAIALALTGLPEEIKAKISIDLIGEAKKTCDSFASRGLSGQHGDFDDHFF
jgi:hypothetical protein